MKHPSDRILLAAIEGNREESASVREHLETGCEACRARMHVLEGILASLRMPPLPAAPDAWREAALERVRALEANHVLPTAPVGQGRQRGKVERVLDEIRMGLALDSGLVAALPGIRGTTALQPRQILFESPQGEVHLRIEPEASKKLQILGQFLPAPEASGASEKITGSVTLESEGRETIRKLTPHGEFQFRAVKPSEVRIRIAWGELVLSLGPLDLSAGPGR